MFLAKYALCSGLGYVEVYLGGGNGAVTQVFLDEPYVHPGFQQQGGKGVAEHVWGHPLLHLCHKGVLGDDISHRLGGQWCSQTVYKDPGALPSVFLRKLHVPGQYFK